MEESNSKPANAERKQNRLGQEKSPYLLQHSYNPVDWYPWGEEAFEKARSEDKPVFLSIGYSTCYWCHVMEREIFENTAIAEMMNRLVVSIKVDREERPDIDRIYMTALQGMTGSGGWPMSLFLLPDRKPFFAGTYFPPESRAGMMGFPEILKRVCDVWINDRLTVLKNCEYMYRFLVESSTPHGKAHPLSEKTVVSGFEQVKKFYDPLYGGFSDAPKFPQAAVILFLFRYYKKSGDESALTMALTTLQKMARGGMYDQIGGGFHRYSTDERWHVPHFEKMLYDQAQLILAYLEAFQMTRDPFYKKIAYKTLEYVRRVLMDSGGGFYCAEDAESSLSSAHPIPKEEGAFYTWTKKEIDSLLAGKELRAAELIYGLPQAGETPTGEWNGKFILTGALSMQEIARMMGETESKLETLAEGIKQKIFAAREKRVKPACDDKVLLSWNGLMVSAFVRASQVLGDKSYLEDAKKTCTFIQSTFIDPQTRHVLRRYRAGEVKYDAQLADYACYIQGILDVYEASFEIDWLQKAVELTGDQISLFYDEEKGGFYDTSGLDSTIMIRSKEMLDGAEPNAHAVAIMNLLRLSNMTGRADFLARALKSLESLSGHLEKNPFYSMQFLIDADYYLSDPVRIVFAVPGKKFDLNEMLSKVHSMFLPYKVLLLADQSKGQEYINKSDPSFRYYKSIGGKPAVYICKNQICELPASNAEEIHEILERHASERIQGSSSVQESLKQE
jgi:uncharacterized protein YyaL (SSP411 family)